MSNMLDLELSGTGAPHVSADLDVHEPPRSGTALDVLAVGNLPLAEELYFKFLQDPPRVDPQWGGVVVGPPPPRRGGWAQRARAAPPGSPPAVSPRPLPRPPPG